MPIEGKMYYCITPEDIGRHFAQSDSQEQASILYWVASELEEVHSKEYNSRAVNFCFQADAISREDSINCIPKKRDYLIYMLEQLLHHVKEGKREYEHDNV